MTPKEYCDRCNATQNRITLGCILIAAMIGAVCGFVLGVLI